jgi:hypothetical protein
MSASKLKSHLNNIIKNNKDTFIANINNEQKTCDKLRTLKNKIDKIMIVLDKYNKDIKEPSNEMR